MDAQGVTFKFMESFSQWKSLSPEEKQIRLQDIEVIFREAKDLITKALIEKGFKPGSKIIDITSFTGLNEFGFTIASFLVQHQDGGEIRNPSMKIDLKRMDVRIHINQFYSNGKERYWYLKRNKLN